MHVVKLRPRSSEGDARLRGPPDNRSTILSTRECFKTRRREKSVEASILDLYYCRQSCFQSYAMGPLAQTSVNISCGFLIYPLMRCMTHTHRGKGMHTVYTYRYKEVRGQSAHVLTS